MRRGGPDCFFSMLGSQVSRSVAISLASEISGKLCGGIHSSVFKIEILSVRFWARLCVVTVLFSSHLHTAGG